MPQIHPTAIIEPGAHLADDVQVGPMCYVGPNVRLGPNTRLMHRASVMGKTTLGENNIIWPNALVGAEPQDLKHRGEETELVIGSDNQIREAATIHCGTAHGGGVTRVGSHNLIMGNVHIGHDCMIGSHCVLTNAVLLAGHVHIEDHVVLGGGSAVHHFVTIGQFAFVGGMTPVRHDVPPYMIFEGCTPRIRAVNTIGIKRNGFSDESVEHLKFAFRLLFREQRSDDDDSDPNPSPQAFDHLAQLEQQYPSDPCIQYLVGFLRNMRQGVYGRYRESFRTDKRYLNPAK
ncbi:MAG: acyl-ACP--UDP-N-acetylglucosamine O-acyltransferase [Phycisphaeraceae bacterium]|nr:acyl-ACP--UDP-N-acetylglucosamine O-acyltransferase [Phycisphaeraceae bacterium]